MKIEITEQKIEKLKEYGERWTKYGKDRIYLDIEKIVEIEDGMGWGMELNGIKFNKKETRELMNSRIFVDLQTGEISCYKKYLPIFEAFIALMNTPEVVAEEAEEAEEVEEVEVDTLAEAVLAEDIELTEAVGSVEAKTETDYLGNHFDYIEYLLKDGSMVLEVGAMLLDQKTFRKEICGEQNKEVKMETIENFKKRVESLLKEWDFPLENLVTIKSDFSQDFIEILEETREVDFRNKHISVMATRGKSALVFAIDTSNGLNAGVCREAFLIGRIK